MLCGAGPAAEMPGVHVSKLSLVSNARGQVAAPAAILQARKAALDERSRQRKVQRTAARDVPAAAVVS
jgi:hypothetical protein